MTTFSLAERYAAGSAVDPSYEVTEAEERAAEAMSDAEWAARFDDETAEVDR